MLGLNLRAQALLVLSDIAAILCLDTLADRLEAWALRR